MVHKILLVISQYLLSDLKKKGSIGKKEGSHTHVATLKT
jgi:hypothetical protein